MGTDSQTAVLDCPARPGEIEARGEEQPLTTFLVRLDGVVEETVSGFPSTPLGSSSAPGCAPPEWREENAVQSTWRTPLWP